MLSPGWLCHQECPSVTCKRLNCSANICIVLIDPVYTVGARANQKAISACLSKRTATSDAYAGPSYEKILAMRKKFVTPSAVPFYRKPLLIHRGDMQYLYDHKGAKYLGMSSHSFRHHPHGTQVHFLRQTCSAALWQFLWDIVIRKHQTNLIKKALRRVSSWQESQSGAGAADEDALAHNQHLHAAENLRVRREARVETARRTWCRVPRKQRLGSQRSGDAAGATVHAEPWYFDLEKLVPRSQHEHNGTNRLFSCILLKLFLHSASSRRWW